MGNTFNTTSASAPAGLHLYTLEKLVAAVKHALGATPDNKTTPEEIVNDSIQLLAAMHPWGWKHAPLSLDTVAAQKFVNLPTDYAALHSIHQAGGFYELRPATLSEIQRLRASPVGLGLSAGYWYAETWQSQEAGINTPRARLELYPTPAAATVGAFTGTYVRVIKALTGNANTPDIPAVYHPLLKQLCRAKAVSDEEQQAGEDWRVFNEMLPRFVAMDAGQANLGQMRGVARGDDPDSSGVYMRGTIVAP